MIKKAIKKCCLFIPPVRRYVNRMRQTSELAATQAQEIASLKSLLENSSGRVLTRSPGLSSSESDLRTERLLAHPAILPLPEVSLGSHPASDNPDRIVVAERLLNAYHKSLEDEHKSRLRREGEDVWTGLIRNELPELMEIIENRNTKELADFLMNFGQSFVWYGGITTCVDGYSRDLDQKQTALTFLDKLVCLGESLGVLRHENPESGPWGENLHVNQNDLIEKIEKHLGISISPPLEIIYTDGLQINDQLFHYRHINGLYSATRIAELTPHRGPVCEFGGGLGITAMYSRRLGVTDYTMLDLPITCLLAGHYLLHAVGLDSVSLYGEEARANSIKILPFWECLNLPNDSFELTINQDSFPEIADNLIYEYLTEIKRITTDHFLSINQEYFHPRTVNYFIRESTGYKEIYRSKCWVREGYLEELFGIGNSSLNS